MKKLIAVFALLLPPFQAIFAMEGKINPDINLSLQIDHYDESQRDLVILADKGGFEAGGIFQLNLIQVLNL